MRLSRGIISAVAFFPWFSYARMLRQELELRQLEAARLWQSRTIRAAAPAVHNITFSNPNAARTSILYQSFVLAVIHSKHRVLC